MRIANPIYDAVFKYLMDDNSLAKLLLSTILDEEIIELTFTPQEHTAKLNYPRHFTVYRLDFAATIRNSAGETRKVLIEVQKAKLVTDIMRFRRYLGEQYRDPNNAVEVGGRKQALPLLTIYFLGHALEHSSAPVIHVKRESHDLITKEPLAHKETFIETLTHDSYIIQIPHLGEQKRNAVEDLLQIFNQKLISHDQHVLEFNESDMNERYRPILRRLQRAIVEKSVEEAMDIEDDILTELQDLERSVEKAEAKAEQAEAKTEQAELKAEQAEAKARQAEVENQRLLALLKQAGVKS